MSSLLSQQEAASDTYYGFPAGTLEALGASESSNGLNMGSLGNVFQVLPSTAADPGYGITGVNGNSPQSVGAYLSALINGPGGGSVANGLALYQGRPIGSTGNSAMSSFLASIGANASTGANAGLTGALGALGLGPGINPANLGSNPAATTLATVLRIAFAILALTLIALGIAALALKSDPGKLAVQVASKAGAAALA